MTHAELVCRAERWLCRSARVPYVGYPDRTQRIQCAVVLTEYTTTIMETPDAIGWAHGGRSISEMMAKPDGKLVTR